MKMEWMPIETAPKDGTKILAVGANFGDPSKGHHIAIVSWTRRAFRAENCDFPSWGKSIPKNAYRNGSDSYVTPGLFFLTHWMPLPDPPTE